MANRRSEKPNKGGFSRTLLKIAVAGASAYLMVAFVGGQMQLAQKQQELQVLDEKVQKQQQQNEELLSLMESDDESAYIERIAREQLGYVRPDERIFMDISGQ